MANHALQRTRRERRGCNRGVPCAGSLSLGRSPQQSKPIVMRPIFIPMFFLCASLAVSEEKKATPQVTAPKQDSPELRKGKERLEECRKLFREGKQNEAIKLATESVDVFVAPYPQLRWIDVGSLETEKYRVVIHVNTTEDERANPRKFIVRPYTFCVFPKEPDGKLLGVIDFEFGYNEKGVLESAALGRYTGGSHLNYGMIDIKADFGTVREAALELIKKDVIKPSKE